jgi:hypothetical protein
MARLTKQSFEDYRATRKDDKEALRWSLYDTLAYAAAGQVQLNFFKTPVGGTKFFDDTNMDLAGQVQAGWIFRAKFIELRFKPGVLITPAIGAAPTSYANDVAAFYENGWLNFKVSQKDIVIDGPLGQFPPLTRLAVSAGVSGTFAATNIRVTEYAQAAGKHFVLDPVITIAPNQSFALSLNWKAAVALPSTVAGSVQARLVGQLARDI